MGTTRELVLVWTGEAKRVHDVVALIELVEGQLNADIRKEVIAGRWYRWAVSTEIRLGAEMVAVTCEGAKKDDSDTIYDIFFWQNPPLYWIWLNVIEPC